MEGKFWKQVDHPPSTDEVQDVREGYLDILRYFRGKFERINEDGKWEKVAIIPEVELK